MLMLCRLLGLSHPIMVPSINNNHHKVPLSGGAKNIWTRIAKHYNFTIHDTVWLVLVHRVISVTLAATKPRHPWLF